MESLSWTLILFTREEEAGILDGCVMGLEVG